MNPRFSDRMGFTHPPSSIQLDSMNDPLANSIYNFILLRFGEWDSLRILVTLIASEFLKVPLDKVPLYEGMPYMTKEWLREIYFPLRWYEKYNLLEFVADNAHRIPHRFLKPTKESIQEWANQILEREMSGYRFIQGELVPISSQAEVEAIEQAVSKSVAVGLEGARIHLLSSLELLGRKPEPDFRNSIKEAISAVESAVKSITGEAGGGLNKALKELASRAPIHPALEQGFRKLYGYTSDEDGIRHAILEQADVGFDEAKFMLVSCSAFVNFLISKAEATSLLKKQKKGGDSPPEPPPEPDLSDAPIA